METLFRTEAGKYAVSNASQVRLHLHFHIGI